jgi:hypothetical protein
VSGRDVPFDEEVAERRGVLADLAPLAEVEAARDRFGREFDAAAVLADLHALLDSPLPTRPTRGRLLTRAIAALQAREPAHSRRA